MCIRKKLMFFLIVFFGITHMGFAQMETGIAISDNGSDANKSAILDVSSTGRGVLFPRVVLTGVATNDPNDLSGWPLSPTLSLTVFVTEPEIHKGYYFWDFDLVYEQLRWVKLSSHEQSFIDNKPPNGSIVMYVGNYNLFDGDGKGSQGSVMQGWHICNGENDTPDLRSHFLVGGTADNIDYDRIGQKGGQRKHRLSVFEIPYHEHLDYWTDYSVGGGTHGHEIDFPTGSVTLPLSSTNYSVASHLTMDLESGLHAHSVSYPSDNGELNTSNGGSGQTIDYDLYDQKYESVVNLISTGSEHQHSSIVNHASSNINKISGYLKTVNLTLIDEHTHEHTCSYSSGSESLTEFHENRPPAYVVVYIMRIDEGDNFDPTDASQPAGVFDIPAFTGETPLPASVTGSGQ